LASGITLLARFIALEIKDKTEYYKNKIKSIIQYCEYSKYSATKKERKKEGKKEGERELY
jgi:hypothetical protein